LFFFFENFERKSSILVSALKKKAAKKAGKNFNFFFENFVSFEFFLPFLFTFWDDDHKKKNKREKINR